MQAIQVHEGFQKYEKLLRAYAFKLTKDREDANDLIQETTYRALKNQDKFRIGTNLKSWLYTIMKNVFINNYRKTRRKKTLFDFSDNQYLLDSGDHRVENLGENSILHQELMGMVNGLNPEYRVPFLMAFQGYKYEEISDEMNLPLGTTKSRIFHARRMLKAHLATQYQAHELSDILN